MTTPFSRWTGPGIALSAVAQCTGGLMFGDDPKVTGVRQDSRQVLPGEVFLARRGANCNGLDYINAALARGARAVMAQRDHAPASLPAPLVLVDDARDALAKAASAIYADPTRHLTMVGITGTNGKTTTASLLRTVLQNDGHRAALMGTLGVRFEEHSFNMTHNTPEADELMRALAWLRSEGASHVIMEATSHALAHRRVDGVRYRVAAFTNLTHDHLDLHGDFESYAHAKARLFTRCCPDLSVIMVDDPFGAQLAKTVSGPVIRVSRYKQVDADVYPAGGAVTARRIRACVCTPFGRVELRSPLFGEHNLANVLLALAIAIGLGAEPQKVATALGEAYAPEGRLQRCDGPNDDIRVFVDYAHTPDALEKVLTAVRALTCKRLLCVFGCGGERDPTKRPSMGKVADRLADIAIITNDNPRGERPSAIAEAIVGGMVNADHVVELDRERAIRRAIELANAEDIVLVAGKGHEKEQELDGRRLPFSDVDVVLAALRARRNERAGQAHRVGAGR